MPGLARSCALPRTRHRFVLAGELSPCTARQAVGTPGGGGKHSPGRAGESLALLATVPRTEALQRASLPAQSHHFPEHSPTSGGIWRSCVTTGSKIGIKAVSEAPGGRRDGVTQSLCWTGSDRVPCASSWGLLLLSAPYWEGSPGSCQCPAPLLERNVWGLPAPGGSGFTAASSGAVQHQPTSCSLSVFHTPSPPWCLFQAGETP